MVLEVEYQSRMSSGVICSKAEPNVLKSNFICYLQCKVLDHKVVLKFKNLPPGNVLI